MFDDTSKEVVIKQADMNDAERRSSTWATMPATSKGPALCANEEQSRRIRAWEVHGLAPPTPVGAQRRDVYGNVIKAVVGAITAIVSVVTLVLSGNVLLT